jgi:hypothetical protein
MALADAHLRQAPAHACVTASRMNFTE